MQDYKVTFTGQDNLSPQVKKIKNELNDLNQSANNLDKIQSKFDRITNSSAPLQRKLKDLQNLMADMKFKGLDNTDAFKTIQQEAQKTKKAIEDAKDAIGGLKNSGGNGLQSIMGSFGGIAKYATLAGAAMGAMEIGGEIINKVREFCDESMRLAQEAEGVRHAFLALGDESTLEGLRQATHGTVNDLELMKSVVQANDFGIPIDQLGKYLEFAQLKAQQTGQNVDYLVNSIVTGLGRQSLQILDNLGLSAAELKDKMAEGKTMAEAVGEVIDTQLDNVGEHFETTAERAQQRLVALQNEQIKLGQELLPIKDAWDEVQSEITNGALDIAKNIIMLIGNSDDLQTAILNIKDAVGGVTTTVKNAIKYYKEAFGFVTKLLQRLVPVVNTLMTIRDLFNSIKGSSGEIKPIRMTNDADIEGGRRLNQEMQNIIKSRKELNKLNKEGNKSKGGKSSTKKTEKSSLEKLKESTKKVDYSTFASAYKNRGETIKVPVEYVPIKSDVEKKRELNGDTSDPLQYEKERAEALKGLFKEAENIQVQFDSGNLLQSEAEQKLAMIQQMLNDAGLKVDVSLDTTKMEKDKQKLNDVKSAIGDFSSALGSIGTAIEVPELDIVGTIAQAIANIALSYAEAAKSPAVTSTGWGWIAFAAAGLAEMMAVIASIKSSTGFATGGIVGGTSYSGDKLLARVNSGEMILPAKKANELGNMLNENATSSYSSVEWKIKGADLYGTLHNFSKVKAKSGKITGIK